MDVIANSIIEPSGAPVTDLSSTITEGELPSSEIADLLATVSTLATRLRHGGGVLPNGEGDIPQAEHAILGIIDRFGSVTVPQIAREHSTSRQNVQIMIDRLEREGHVELFGNPAHKRSALIRLTQQGKECLAAGQDEQKHLHDELGSRISSSQIGLTLSVLKNIHGYLSNGKQIKRTAQKSDKAPTSGNPTPPDTSSRAGGEIEAEEFPINLL